MEKENNVKISNFTLIIALFLFLVLGFRIAYLSLSKEVDNINIQQLASKRTTKTTILKANRGTIFDNSGNILAQDVSSYTLIAYLDESRTTDPDKTNHVVDKENTALVLAALLNMEYETVLSYLSKENVYQTEFGPNGKGLTELEKDTILAANLPGIDFIETTKRYYPYGKFLSYLIGYAKNDENLNMVGELGIEKSFNEELTGIDGKSVYQKDLNGYKIAGTKEIVDEKVDGSDIYLTIDNNVQFFLEQAINESSSKYTYDEITIIIANAKTGEILGYGSNPSFDPNIRDIKNYMDPNSATAFEPGSTMKIYTYMAALEAGVYKGNDTYVSGKYQTKDKTVISDWNKVGWGTITYDQGFIYSSNTAVVNLMDKYLEASELKSYLKKLGFSSKTGIPIFNEASGKIEFKYETEVFNAAFGQGITTTPIQHIKALTSISNDGELLEPFIIKKIVKSNGEVLEYNKKTLGSVASSETIQYMKNLMWHTINDSDGAGHAYYLEGYDIIGKTGTAQIASTNGLGYLQGDSDVIRSVSLMFPKDDPEIIIYGAVKRSDTVSALSEPIKEIIENVTKYYNIMPTGHEDDTKDIIEIKNYVNENLSDIKTTLEKEKLEVVVVGDGDTIVRQYPTSGKVVPLNKIFLLTNGMNYVMPDLTHYSRSDVEIICQFLNLNYQIKGNGYVVSQSIIPDTKVTSNMEIEIILENRKTKEE